MKTLMAAAVAAALLVSPGAARPEPIGADKGLHFAAGAAVSQTSYPAFKALLKSDVAARVCAVGAAFLVSLAKEVSDGRRFDGKDLAAGTLGGGTVLLFRVEW